MVLTMFWNSGRRSRVFWALFLGLILGFLLYLPFGDRHQANFFSGDFPAFYAAGYIVAQGWGHELYNYELQRNIENLFWPDFEGEMYIFAYPPYVATLLAPLGFLSPMVAKLIFNLLLFGALVWGLVLLRPFSSALRDDFRLSLLIAFTFAPVFSAVVGAQNTTLSILLYSGIMAGLARKTGRGELVAGICAGLFLYKPQFAITVLPVVLILGGKRAFCGVAIVAFLYYLLGCIPQGFFWPLLWLEEATRFGNINFTINADRMISIVGAAYSAAYFLGITPEKGLPIGYLLSAGIFITLIVFAVLARKDELKRWQVLCLLGPVMVLVSPQSLYYDLGILVVSVLPFLNFERTRQIWEIAAFWGLAAFLMPLRDVSEVPFFFMLGLVASVAVLLWGSQKKFT